MRKYFQKLENCGHWPLWRLLSKTRFRTVNASTSPGEKAANVIAAAGGKRGR